MKLLDGKRGLVFGVANERSIAWAIARAAHAHGAELLLSYQDDRLLRRVAPLAEQVGASLLQCDVTDDATLDAFFAAAGDRVDFLVHSVAFADRDALLGDFVDTTREAWTLAQEVSAHSLVELCRRAAPLMTGGGSVVALSYYGAEKAMPRYNVMGPAKAALEAAVRYLALDLGPRNIRINALSAGPLRTLAAAGIPGFRDMLKSNAERAPLRRYVTQEEVADAALFLLCDLARGITGETLHVDAGYHAIGF